MSEKYSRENDQKILPELVKLYAADVGSGWLGSWYLLHVGIDHVRDKSERMFRDECELSEAAGGELPFYLDIERACKMFAFAKKLSGMTDMGIAAWLAAIGKEKELEAQVIEALGVKEGQ